MLEKYFKSIGETFVPEPEIGSAPNDALTGLPNLIKKLSHEDFAIRVQAAQTLRDLGPEARLACSRTRPRIRRHAP